MFHFRLDRVLRWRRRCEEERARELKRAVDELARQETLITNITEEIRRIGALAATTPAGTPDVTVLRHRAVWLAHLGTRRQELHQERAALVAKVGEARSRLVEAHRDCEILVRLRERQRAAWEAEEARRERKQMDEIVGLRVARRRVADLA
jgi:flagellar export protein FliJ